MQVHSISTENQIEITRAVYRGFAISEFIWIVNGYSVDHEDGEYIGRAIVIHHLFRAIRIKTGEETYAMRGYSIDEVKQQIENNLGQRRHEVAIPF